MVKVIIDDTCSNNRIEWAFMELELNKRELFDALYKIVGRAIQATDDGLYGDLTPPVKVIDKGWAGTDILLDGNVVGVLSSMTVGKSS